LQLPKESLKYYCIPTLLAAAYLAGCASGNAPRTANRSPLGIEAQMAQSIAAEEKLESADFEKRLAALQGIIAAPTFKGLPDDAQYRDLLTAGKLAIVLGQQKRGYDFLVRAAASVEATLDVRLLQVQVALKLGLKVEAVNGLKLLAQHWPDQVADLPRGLFDAVFHDAANVPHATHLSLLQALYAIHWKLKWDIEPSAAWRDLSLLLLETGSLTEGIDVASHVKNPYVLIGMRADRRFDAVVEALPAEFDIEAAAARQLKNFESASDQQPSALALKLQVIVALGNQQHYAAMLAESDSVVSAIESTNFPEKLFVDYYDQYDSLLNLRAIALQREGQMDEAVAQFKAAAVDNKTDQLINLASFYCDLGRPADALDPIRRVRGDTSPYGAMVLESVRLEAAVQLGDRGQIATSLRYLQSHAADAPGAYLDGLLSANQLDRAAHVLVEQLRDRDQRQEALTRVQTYALPPQTTRETEITSRWREVVARREVQAAIDRVGRVDSYPLEEP
jgi:tetratricopeptide (TPR) repeat protein